MVLRAAAVCVACIALTGCGAGGSTPTATSRTIGANTVAQLANGPLAETTTTTAVPAADLLHGSAARRAAVPILMYHVLGTPAPGTPLQALWVSPASFRAQMRALATGGYHPVTLSQVFAAWRRGAPLPRRAVVLSFDDGYLSHATIAAPELAKRGWPGELNLEVHDLGAKGLPRHLAKRMIADGWEVASHTVTHPDMTAISDAQRTQELTQSRKDIAALLGVTPRFFCYPAGRYDARVEAAVRAAGYLGATTEVPGVAKAGDDPYALPRLRITNADGPSELLARLRASG